MAAASDRGQRRRRAALEDRGGQRPEEV